MEENISKLQELINSSSKIVFFGGAGVSTESGIPDFRSTDGLYHQKWDYPPETILSHEFFFGKTKEFYRFYREKLLVSGIEPNAAHKKLAEMEEKGKLLAVITQNIDGLHQSAGSKKVLELHGSTLRNYCTKCGKFYDADYIRDNSDEEGIPRCMECGGLIKPDVVLYNEGLDDKCVSDSINALMEADLLIIGGTSLTVYPAAGLIQYYRGKDIVLINRDPGSGDNIASLAIHDSIGKVLSQIKV
ncbi:NAD-dependent protein deacylase [Treponema sp.]|uniref:NAD-dependent protein deacylase n=1 Tax=Treponema sp. TaxID=166 RepID=UPI0025E452D9|nr:NAD-dependent protein deacylase [Treponema sp.]MCR5218021.1 NAD-dependent protein deacylase [Treponema sp.]